MSRLAKTTVLLAVTCLLPVLALRAQQPPPAGQERGPATKGVTKGEVAKAATDPIIERIKEEGLEAVAGHGDLELPDRRDRSAAHRVAQHEAGQRVDARQAGRLGCWPTPTSRRGGRSAAAGRSSDSRRR